MMGRFVIEDYYDERFKSEYREVKGHCYESGNDAHDALREAKERKEISEKAVVVLKPGECE